jgi:hypothetical protein
VTTQSATDAYKSVLSDVGQTQPMFDDHDIRMVDETLNGTYKYKGSVTGKPGFPDKESDVGGYESYPNLTRASSWDSDKDGLPDFWEKMIGTNPNSGANDFSDSNADKDKDGYTNLEDYLNWMAEMHYFVSYAGTQTIDLAAMFKGYTKTSPTYSVTGVENGTVTISGSTATFKTKNCGFASFNLIVKDNANATMTKKIGVFVESQTAGSCTAKVYDCAGVENGTAKLDNCGVCTGGTSVNKPCTISLEAESACFVDGSIDSDNAGFSGSGFVNTTNIEGAFADWVLSSPSAQTATISFRYANGGSTSRDGQVIINGKVVSTVLLPPTSDWTTWKTVSTNLSLSKGYNNLSLRATTADGLANIDQLILSSGVTNGNCVVTGLEFIAQKTLKIYPNPTKGQVHLSEESDWELYNIQGQKLSQGQGIVIDMNDTPTGIYFIRIESEVIKVVKE